MSVNNFQLIANLLDFSDPKTFYFIQILKRRKENPDMKTGVRVIDNFYLYETEDFEKIKDKIIDTCKINNARAYINVNRLDLERVALFTSKKIIELIIQGDYKAVKNAYTSVCGSYSSQNEKRWIVDIDVKDDNIINKVCACIRNLQQEITKSNYKVLAVLPTKNGVHIISNPFNLQKFKERFPDIEVHKSGLTVLFIP